MLLTENQITNLRKFEAIKAPKEKKFYISVMEAFFLSFCTASYLICLGYVLING